MKKNGRAIKSVTERSVININGTLYVSIPKAFVDRHSIQPGDRLPMILDDSQLKIIPHEKLRHRALVRGERAIEGHFEIGGFE